jgi:23S rRNA A2030 N6-methylase RlmJ
MFEKYIDLQKQSADKHKGEIQEHDGYVFPNEDKFFACAYADRGLAVISIPFEELDKYDFVSDLNSMLPLVRLKT